MDIIKENLKKIEAFCLENFCSRLKDCEALTVNMNENPEWRFIPVSRYQYSFKVTKDNIYFTEGIATSKFLGDEENVSSVYRFTATGKQIILHWQEIKSGLFAELEKLITEEETINNFQV